MAIVKKIKRLQDELNDLQRLIDIDSQLVEKYPEDSFLKMSLQQYLDRKTTLQTKLRLEIF
ncbi:MAG: hypothetical protein EAY79_00130 [Runella slithyformis]|nr:MAG: hypothetical protein EAY79_00130 [Runella slithyformis]TAF30664.1 MAG: hypothetical protein EAZ67_13940 [Cytophagales bacterium]